MKVTGIMVLALVCACFSSCTLLEGVDVDGRIYYVDQDSGAKGGIDLVAGEKPAVWLKLPSFSKSKNGVHVELEPVVIEPQK